MNVQSNFSLNEQLSQYYKQPNESQRNLQILKSKFSAKKSYQRKQNQEIFKQTLKGLDQQFDRLKNASNMQQYLQEIPSNFQVNSDNQSRNVVIFAPPPDKDRNPFLSEKFHYSQELLQLENKIKYLEKQLIKEKELEQKKKSILNQQVQPEEHQNFDFLTNYNQLPVIEQEDFSQEYSNEQSTDKNKVSRKNSGQIFSQNQSQQRFSNQNIKLGIIGQNRPQTHEIIDKYSQEHQLRVITKEGTPFISKPLINKIKSRKDLATLQVQSYLNDYQPFLQGNLDGIPYNSQKLILQKFAEQQNQTSPNFSI